MEKTEWIDGWISFVPIKMLIIVSVWAVHSDL